MDAYELATQLSVQFDSEKVIEDMRNCMPALQSRVDFAKSSDEMALAGKPLPASEEEATHGIS